MRFCHISDTHFGTPQNFDRRAFLDALGLLSREEFDVIIHTGDVTEDGRSESFLEAKRAFELLHSPLVVIPGNHDDRSGGVSYFESLIGPANGVLIIGEALIIFVNSAIHDLDDGRVGIVKFDMLREALARHQDAPIKIVAIHHHIMPIPRAGRERNVLSNAGDLLDLFLRNDVDLVVSGHRHFPNVYKVNNTVFVNAGTFSCRKTRFGDKNSFNIVDISKRTVSIETTRVDGSHERHLFTRHSRRIFHQFGQRRLRLVQISNTLITHASVFLRKMWKSSVQRINELGADVVVHCGGIVNEGTPDDYKLAKQYMADIEVPILFTPAARDINFLGFHLFRQTFGSMDQSFSNEIIFIQGVSSAQYDSPIGMIGETQRRALFDALRKVQAELKCVFLHHNVAPIPFAREKGLLEDGGDFLREAVDEGVDVILTGTSSHPYAVSVEGTIIVNANSLCGVYQRSLFGNSFNVIDIHEDIVVVSEINSLWGARRILGIWPRDR